MEFFFKIYNDLPKQGPGSTESTLKALRAIPDYQKLRQVLDLGCGTGRHTITLAQNTSATITALEFYDQQIARLTENIQKVGLSKQINIVKGDMANLKLAKGEFDLIWSESSIYNIGFEVGLKQWKKYIEEEGYLAVSEAVWLTNNPSEKIKTWWHQEYPNMVTIDQNKRIIQSCGYDLIECFTLPQNDWWEGYYQPLEKRISQFENNNLSPEEQSIITMTKTEIAMFKDFSDQYGYAFFIMKNK